MFHAASGRRGPLSALLAAGLVGSTALSSGCLDRRTADAGSARVAELAIGYADARPRNSVQRGINTVISNLTDARLLALGRDGRSVPALVERWQESADGLTWHFTLREGLTLQDGTALTAAIARASLAESLSEVQRPAQLLPGLRSITGIEVTSDRDFIVRLSRPNGFLLESLPFSSPHGGRDGTQTAGAFRLVSRNTDGAVLAAFPQYYRGRPRLERILIKEYPSARNAWGAMMRGEIDFLYDVGPEALDFIEKSSTTLVATFLRPYVTALVFNEKHPVLKQREVRVALSEAVDRDAIIRMALRGRGSPATGHVWPKHWAYDAGQPRFAFDAADAAARLDARGLRPRRAAGREGIARFAFTCLVPADDPRFEQVALLVQKQLVEIGVDMRIEGLPVPVLQQRVAAGAYDAFLFELGSYHGLEWVYWFWHSNPVSPYFTSGYTAADAVLDRIRDARTDDERRRAVGDLQRVMHDDPPAAFLYWSETSRALSRRFEIPAVDDRDILSTLPQWRLARPGTE